MLSVIIPSYKDPLLQRTIDSLFENAEGDIEIIAVVDGARPNPPLKDDPRLKVIYRQPLGLRSAMNMGAAIAKGKYLMKSDAHCMFDKGFDVKLAANCEDNWIVIPRRYKLDIVHWEICKDDPGPIDYEKIIFDPKRIHGQPWPSRAKKRKDIMVDDDMIFQGSCWFMTAKHYNDFLHGMSEVGYGTISQEIVELDLKTWLGGGRVVVNKNTWYAHKHRKFSRTHQMNQAELETGYAYSYDYWMNNRWPERIHDIEWLREKFQC